MSIDEVMDAAVDYSNASWLDQDKARDALIAAIEQHVAEAVARERDELLDLVDRYAKNNTDLKDAIRARAEKDVP